MLFFFVCCGVVLGVFQCVDGWKVVLVVFGVYVVVEYVVVWYVEVVEVWVQWFGFVECFFVQYGGVKFGCVYVDDV